MSLSIRIAAVLEYQNRRTVPISSEGNENMDHNSEDLVGHMSVLTPQGSLLMETTYKLF